MSAEVGTLRDRAASRGRHRSRACSLARTRYDHAVLTDQTATALPRARTRAPQLTRLAWLAMLLFSLLFTHGLQGESAAGHLEAGV